MSHLILKNNAKEIPLLSSPLSGEENKAMRV
jgi:hypothetical protein